MLGRGGERVMRFLELVGAPVGDDFEVANVCDDTRLVQPGDVFVWDSRVLGGDAATRQTRSTALIAEARAKGARAIVSDVGGDGVVEMSCPGEALARWAVHAHPRMPAVMLGVTGTSGKTSVAWFGRQLASAAGKKAASVGTLGVMRHDNDWDEYTGYTSPSALKLHPILDRLAGEGVTHCLMEVSSHALDLHRAEGVRFKAAGITNVTQDHLDYHHTWEDYFAAKLRLFSELLPDGGVAVVNARRLELLPLMAVVKQRGIPLLTVGTGNAELVVEVLDATPQGLDVALKFDAVPVPLRLPLVGSFQAENLAVALGLLVGGGLPWKEVAAAAARVTAVPGRMEIIGTGHKEQGTRPGVVVDYAHKPDALQRALEALRPSVKGNGKLRVVFGCGGNRDATKRPIMGRIAAELADVVYVTDDNPRKEDAAKIRAEVLAGTRHEDRGTRVVEIGDRRAAIEAAIGEAGPEDVVLVAGKGHEDGQIVGDEVLPFDDRDVVREVLG